MELSSLKSSAVRSSDFPFRPRRRAAGVHVTAKSKCHLSPISVTLHFHDIVCELSATNTDNATRFMPGRSCQCPVLDIPLRIDIVEYSDGCAIGRDVIGQLSADNVNARLSLDAITSSPVISTRP